MQEGRKVRTCTESNPDAVRHHGRSWNGRQRGPVRTVDLRASRGDSTRPAYAAPFPADAFRLFRDQMFNASTAAEKAIAV